MKRPGTGISPTQINKIIGKNNEFSCFDPESIDAMSNHQEALIKKNKGSQGVIIMDDCLGTVDFNHRFFSKLFRDVQTRKTKPCKRN